jgi:ABC-type multidrug transport system fused ATPase/permease subunit
LLFGIHGISINKKYGYCAVASSTAMDYTRDQGHGDFGCGGSRTKTLNYPERSVPDQITHGTGPPLSRVASRDSIIARLGIFDETVDPTHPDFDFERWTQIILDMRARLGLPTPPRSGVVFKKLTVTGNSSAVKEQDTVWKVIAAPFYLRRHLRRKQAKTILHDIDGIVQKGELLLVLGRPGSGCSTFLKTITGKMDALELDSQSVVSYRGIVPYLI